MSTPDPPEWKFETCRRCGIQAAYCPCSQPDVPGLAKCDPTNDVHVEPHRGCPLR